MVKGISKQVIVVQSPDPQLFEQAIFILREDAMKHGGVSEEADSERGKKVKASRGCLGLWRRVGNGGGVAAQFAVVACQRAGVVI